MLAPLRLGLGLGLAHDAYTLWAPSPARSARPGRFLSLDGELVAYRSPAHLAAFLRTAGDHSLRHRQGLVDRDPADLDVVELARGRPRPTLDVDPVEFWRSCGLEPIALDLGAGPLLTVRGAGGRFLGGDGRLVVARGEAALNRWIAHEGFDGHDLAGYPGWALVRERIRLGPLPVPVGDRCYDLARVEAEFAADPRTADPDRLGRLVELLRAFSHWTGDEDRAWAFRRHPVVADLVDPRPGRPRPDPGPPYDTVVADLRALVADLHARTTPVD